MPNDITRLLATVSTLGISLGVGFAPAAAAPDAVATAPPTTHESHIKKAQLHVRKAGGEQESVHHKGQIEVQSWSNGQSKTETVGGARTDTVHDTPPK